MLNLGPLENLGSSRPRFLVSTFPKDPYTAHLRTFVPKTILDLVFGTKVPKWAVYEPFGLPGQEDLEWLAFASFGTRRGGMGGWGSERAPAS